MHLFYLHSSAAFSPSLCISVFDGGGGWLPKICIKIQIIQPKQCSARLKGSERDWTNERANIIPIINAAITPTGKRLRRLMRAICRFVQHTKCVFNFTLWRNYRYQFVSFFLSRSLPLTLFNPFELMNASLIQCICTFKYVFSLRFLTCAHRSNGIDQVNDRFELISIDFIAITAAPNKGFIWSKSKLKLIEWNAGHEVESGGNDSENERVPNIWYTINLSFASYAVCEIGTNCIHDGQLRQRAVRSNAERSG